MRNPCRVDVRMSRAFREALEAYAVEHECTAAQVMLWATKALLGKSHRWPCGTRGRPYAQRAKAIREGIEEVEAC